MFYMLLLLFPLYGHAVQIDTLAKGPASLYAYEFMDMGPVDLLPEELSKYHLPNTLAPLIDNQGKIIYNTSSGCHLTSCQEDNLSARVALQTHCHGIDQKGSLLLASTHKSAAVFWSIAHPRKLQMPLDTGEILGQNLYLRAFVNEMAVGCFKTDGALRPAIWTAKQGVRHLGTYLGWDMQGIAWDVNQLGSVAGHMEDGRATIPFVWSEKRGLKRLQPFQWEHFKSCEGTVCFADAIMGEDDLFYGTFFFQRDAQAVSPYFAFWWDAASDELRLLQLQGMQLNALSQHTFVGQWHGKAALCDLGRKPVLLEKLVRLPAGWNLISATDINAHGEIVGYGKRQSRLHYFVLKRKKMHTALLDRL